MNVRDALAEAYDLCIATGRCKAVLLVETAQQRHPDLFLRESTRLIRQAALREAKAYMKDAEPHSQEDVTRLNQIDLPLGILPGLEPPRTLIVPTLEGDYEHVRYDCATWDDLEQALLEKSKNVDRAMARMQDHILKMDALRPYLATIRTRTVAEGCEYMRKEHGAGSGSPG